jgi:hypothetical protein
MNRDRLLGGTMEPYDTDELLADLDTFLDNSLQHLPVRQGNSHVQNIIEVLLPHGATGLLRPRAINEIELLCRTDGGSICRRFSESVQSVFNQYNVNSVTFDPMYTATRGLFSSRHDGPNAIWIVHPERANAWLRKRCRRLN